MKEQLFFLLLLFSSSYLSAQPIEIIDFEGFNGVNLSEIHLGWQEAQGESQPQTYGSSAWYNTDDLYESTTAGVSINSNTHRDWIISPQFTATPNTRLQFKAALPLAYNEPLQGYFGFDDSMAVMISVNNGAYEPAGLTFDVNNQPGPELSFYELNLAAFAGNEVRIAFYATDGNMANSAAAFILDDVVIKESIPEDVAVMQIISPSEMQCLGDDIPVSVQLRNDGHAPVNSFPVRVRLRGSQNTNLYAIYSGLLQPGESTVFDVGTVSFPNYGNYILSAESELPNDSISYNNSAEINLSHSQSRTMPSELMTFTDFYTDNLNEIYPGWYEARGEGYPDVNMDTDWQGAFFDDSRTANVYFFSIGTRDWLVGPKYTIEDASVLQFRAGVEYDDNTTQMGSDDKLSIMITDDCGATWTEVAYLDANSGLDESLQAYSFDLSAYSGTEIRIALYATTGSIMDSESYLLHIDDLIIKNQFENDAGVTDIISPTASCSFTSSEEISISVTNWGSNSISNIPVSYRLNNGTVVTETINQSPAAGEQITYTFTQTADFTQSNENFLEVWTALPGDEYPENDLLSKTIRLSSFNLSADGTFSMSFEADEDYSDWITDNANGDDNLWEVVEDGSYSHSGNNSMGYFSNNSTLPSDDWLISPCFNLQAGKNYRISFWYRNRASAFPESLKLSYGNEQSGSAMTNVISDLGEISNSEYLQETADFSVSDDGAYYFGWHAYGPADQFGMHIDDIEINQIFDTDLAVTNVKVPRNKDVNCGLLPAEELFVEITNVGTNPVSEFSLAYTLDGGTTETQTYSLSLTAGESTTVTFDQNVSVSPDAAHNISVTAVLAGDENIANDNLVLENYLMSDFGLSFEPSELYGNWTTESNAGVNQWELRNEQSVAHTGNYTYSIRTDGAGGNSSNDDWLFSECFELEAGVCYNLNFFYRSRFSTENLSVYIGTDANSAAMTELLFDDPDFNSDSYLEADVPFTVETSGVYYIAWHTDGGTSGRYFIHIDDVSLNQSVNTPNIISVNAEIFDREAVFSAEIENPGNILWDFGDGNQSAEMNPSHIYEQPGTYTVTLQVSDNCISVEEVLTVNITCSLPEAYFDYAVDDNTVNFTNQTTSDYHEWNFGDGSFSLELNPTHIYDVSMPMSFDVSLSLFNSCGSDQATASIAIFSAVSEQTANIRIFPNPTENYLTVDFPGTGNYRIELSTLAGKTIQLYDSASDIHRISLQEFSPGVYLLTISDNETQAVFKIVKQ